jgi:hypothetical protein
MAEKQIEDIDIVSATLAASVAERWIDGIGDREEIPAAMAELCLKVRAALAIATKPPGLDPAAMARLADASDRSGRGG